MARIMSVDKYKKGKELPGRKKGQRLREDCVKVPNFINPTACFPIGFNYVGPDLLEPAGRVARCRFSAGYELLGPVGVDGRPKPGPVEGDILTWKDMRNYDDGQ